MKQPIQISTKKTANPTPVAATPEALRAEAASRRENGVVIARRVAEADTERQTAAGEYDRALEVFAIDEGGKEPDRSRIANAESKLAGLRRIEADNNSAIALLEAEARQIEIRNLAPSELARIAELSGPAEKLLTVYQNAIRAAKAAETEFYTALKPLRTGEFRAVPEKARASYRNLFDRAEDAAIDVDYQPTITNLNHGEPVFYGPEAFSIRVRRGERNARRASLARAS
jgi:hypothetical protein